MLKITHVWIELPHSLFEEVMDTPKSTLQIVTKLIYNLFKVIVSFKESIQILSLPCEIEILIDFFEEQIHTKLVSWESEATPSATPSQDAYNPAGWLIFYAFLKNGVA